MKNFDKKFFSIGNCKISNPMKNVIRASVLEKRNALSKQEQEDLSRKIADALFQHPKIIAAKTIAFYLAKGSEVKTDEMIRKAVASGKEVLVPVTDHEIKMVRFLGFDKLAEGKFGILEPTDKVEGSEPDVIVIPGVAFGECMHRIGYGKGYYDVYLKKIRAYRIGICYDFQLLEKMPRHEHDEPMDLIITEKRVVEKK